MWRLIKADIEYNRSLFAFLYTVIFLAVIANFVLGGREEYLTQLMFITIVVIGVTAGLEEMKTKRIRIYSGLPVPIRSLGIFRYPVFIAYWISLMVLLWLSTWIGQSDPQPDILFWLMTRSSTVFIWIACMNLAQDLPFCYNSKGAGHFFKWTCNIIGTFAGPLVFFATNPRNLDDSFLVAIAAWFNRAPGALSWLGLSLALMALSVWVYQRRRAFTE